MTKHNNSVHIDSPDQLADKLVKLRAYQEALQGKALQLQQKEAELKQQKIKLLEYRKKILEALRQLLLEDPKMGENRNLMKKYDELLDSIDVDVKDDESKYLMG